MPFISFHAGGCWAPDAPWHKGEQAAVAEVSTLLAGSGERWCRLQHLSRPPWCSLGGLVLSPCLVGLALAPTGSLEPVLASKPEEGSHGPCWEEQDLLSYVLSWKSFVNVETFFLPLHIPIFNSVAVKSPAALVADACCRSSITLLRSSGRSHTEGHTQADTGIFVLVYNPISMFCFVFWRS